MYLVKRKKEVIFFCNFNFIVYVLFLSYRYLDIHKWKIIYLVKSSFQQFSYITQLVSLRLSNKKNEFNELHRAVTIIFMKYNEIRSDDSRTLLECYCVSLYHTIRNITLTFFCHNFPKGSELVTLHPKLHFLFT